MKFELFRFFNFPFLILIEPANDEGVPLTQREKIKGKPSEAFVRPVTNYIDETIIPPNTRARLDLEKRLEGSNGSAINDQVQK
jgi:hypothetical protein